MVNTNQTIEINSAKTEDYVDALMLLHQDWDELPRKREVASVLQGVRAGTISLRDLLVARRGAEIVGSVWALKLSGGVALAKAPALLPAESQAVALQLQATLEERLVAQGVNMLQALIPTILEGQIEALTRQEFGNSMQLYYLVSGSEMFPDVEPTLPFQMKRYLPSQRQLMSDVIEQTYVGTKDFPVLNGRREIAEVLTGYENTGDFSPDRWFFIYSDDQPVGCLLVNEHPDKVCELVYMGLVPQVRGRNWGGHATRWAQWVTRSIGCERLMLAVDAENQPAIRAYTESGFSELDSRVVLLKFLPTENSDQRQTNL